MRTLPAEVALTRVTEWSDGASRGREDYLAAEEPLEIRVNGKPLTVTMRTPGDDEELATGFLWSEGILESIGDVDRIVVSRDGATGNILQIELDGAAFDPAEMQRNFFAASSCGICGKASIEAIRRRGLSPPNAGFRLDPEILCAMPERLRDHQQVFGRTGGLHAAAIFDGAGQLVVLREDIGRHNAVDKVIGWALRKRMVPLRDCVMMVSGRGGFEIVQKALAAGTPVLASVSAPSSLAVKLARELGMTLVGFLRERRFVVYSNSERCL